MPASYFVNTEKLILKSEWKGKGLGTNKARRPTLSNFTAYHRAVIIKTVWFWWRNRGGDQWNGKEGPEIDPHKYSQMIFGQKSKTIEWLKR